MSSGKLPYRDAVAARVLEVATRTGRAHLEVAPQFTQLAVGDRLTCTITHEFVTLVERRRRRDRRRSFRLAPVTVARSFPGHEVSIWMERPEGRVFRLVGVQPPLLLDRDAMKAWQTMDRMAVALCEALAGSGDALRLATEYGKGADRVLIVDHGDRFEVFSRRLFQGMPRRAFELSRDGSLVTYRGSGKRPQRERGKCSPRYDVTLTGDRLRFMGADGQDVARLALPWIAPEDRAEIGRRFNQLVSG